MTDFILGIDLGTTNSCVAVHFDGATEIIPDPDGFTTVPSVVHIAPDGTRTFGRQALDRRAHDPAATIYGAKRLIGRPADAEEIRDLQRYFAYTIVADEKGELAVEVHGQRHSVVDISAWLLDYLRRNAEAWLEQPVSQAVISVPAYFNQRQRDAVQEAGRRAGLDVLRIVNEPTAAALAYRAGQQDQRRIIVYDLGGGTFDVTVLELRDRVFEVLATGGDSFLGGLDFDRSIADHLRERFEAKEQVNIANDQAAIQRLMRAAEQAKIDAGADNQAHITIPFLAKAGEPLPRRLGIDDRCTLDELGAWTDDLIAQTLIICDEVLVEAGMVAREVDEIVLVGGMTRFPPVRARVAGHFGAEPHTGLNPDEVVAAGAAILGDALVRPSEALELVDVLPVSIGMTVNYGPYETVLHRNTRIPALVERDLPTTVDGQTGLAIRLFQGESPNPADNTWLGELVITGIEPRPAGEISVRLRLALDDNGLLEVTAHEASTGQRLEQRFETTPPVEVTQIVTPAPSPDATETPEPETVAEPVAPQPTATEAPVADTEAVPVTETPEPETVAEPVTPQPVAAEASVADTETVPATETPEPETVAEPVGPQPDATEAPVADIETAPVTETPEPETVAEPVAPQPAATEAPVTDVEPPPEPPAAETITEPVAAQPTATETNGDNLGATAVPEAPVVEPLTEPGEPLDAAMDTAPESLDTTAAERETLTQKVTDAIEELVVATGELDALDQELRRLGGDPEIVWSGYAMLRGQLTDLRAAPPVVDPEADLDTLKQTLDRCHRLSREWHGLEPALREAIQAQQAANAARLAALRKDLQERLSTLEDRIAQAALPDDEQRASFVEALETQIEEARQVARNAQASEQLAAVEAAARQFALTEKQLSETLAEIEQHIASAQAAREAAAATRLESLRAQLRECSSAIDALEADADQLPDVDRDELKQRILLLRDDTLQPGGQLARAAADPVGSDLDGIERALTAIAEGIERIREEISEILERELAARLKQAGAKLRKALEQLEAERGLLRDRLARGRGVAENLADDGTSQLEQLAAADHEAAEAVQKVRSMLETITASPSTCDPAALERQAAALLDRVQQLHRETDGAVEQLEAQARERQERKKKRGALGRISLKRVRTDKNGASQESVSEASDAPPESDTNVETDDALFEAQAPTLAEDVEAPSESYQDITQLLTIETPQPDSEDDVSSLFFTEDDFENSEDDIVDLPPPASAAPSPVADVVESDDYIDPDAFAADLVAHGIITSAQLAEADAVREQRTPGFRDFAVAQGYLDNEKAAMIEREQAMLERQYDYKSFAETTVYLGLMTEEEVASIEQERLRTGPALEALLVELGFVDQETLAGERQRFQRQQSSSTLQQLPLPDALQRPALVRLLAGIAQKHAAQLAGLQLAPEAMEPGTTFDAYAIAHFGIDGELTATCELRADYAATYLLATALNPALGMVDDLDPELLKEQFAVFTQQISDETSKRLSQIRGELRSGTATGGSADQPPDAATAQIHLTSPRGSIVLCWHE
ncbi:MAG: hypothetical protein D6761_09175 [Candidatus Dadabacteria bacterium]|nr:MAG: hypothetical protein D6761_09175 [Candidatus Dadabacteria bacterium]